jgi:hypothetical protein
MHNENITGTLLINIVPLTAGAFVVRVRSLSIPDAQNICRCCDNHVMVADLTSSSQVKRCPDK